MPENCVIFWRQKRTRSKGLEQQRVGITQSGYVSSVINNKQDKQTIQQKKTVYFVFLLLPLGAISFSFCKRKYNSRKMQNMNSFLNWLLSLVVSALRIWSQPTIYFNLIKFISHNPTTFESVTWKGDRTLWCEKTFLYNHIAFMVVSKSILESFYTSMRIDTNSFL